jgi:hypothetical protein
VRVLARLLLFIGTFYLLVVLAGHLKMPPQASSFMVIGFLAMLMSNRIVDGK